MSHDEVGDSDDARATRPRRAAQPDVERSDGEHPRTEQSSPTAPGADESLFQASVIMADDASRAGALAAGGETPTLDDLRGAVYADLGRMRAIRAQIEAAESLYLATLRQIEVGQQLHRRLAEVGPQAQLGPEDVRKAEEFARLEVGAEWAIVTQTPPASGPERVERARLLVEGFPAIYTALAQAEITPKLAEVVCEAGAPIDDSEVRAQYEVGALEVATEDGITPQRARPRVRRLAERLMASTREERHERASKRRRVFVVEQPDGMSELVAILPSVQAAGIYDRLTRTAKGLATPNEPRCFDELRADALSALLLTAPIPHVPLGDSPDDDPGDCPDDHSGKASGIAPNIDPNIDPGETSGETSGGTSGETSGGVDTRARSLEPARERSAKCDRNRHSTSDTAREGRTGVGHHAGRVGGTNGSSQTGDIRIPGGIGDESVLAPGHIQATVMVVVPMLSVLGLDDEPATLNGLAPIPLADAAMLAAHAPTWTRVLTCPTTGVPLAVDTYRPSAEQRAFLSIRDKHCRYPGCRAPAHRCDVDHTKDWALGGQTEVCNLSCLCRTHHTRKHAPAWKVTQRERGRLEWVTPSGRRVSDLPAPAGPTFTRSDVEAMSRRASSIAHGGRVPVAEDPPPF